ncbi:cysteine hydrolase family protein [Chelatococcus reniformis]|uniref:Isochorismatase n=1 Tax=Chelatococcus reniformis TaxID=1494448 RepID=A0A916XLS5_9HYPH|nr:cysteine hydrolase family protein [Chelatococcus reniformis]GGC82131.1 isochorismatase [Chelatococcus reniformis]
MSNRALIIVDLQNDYFPGGKFTLSGIDAAAANAGRLLEAWRASGEPVVHVRHEFPVPEAPFFAPGSEGARINAAVATREGEPVVLKHQVNAFRDTDLKDILDGKGVEDVVIVGAMSHMCIDAATRAAADLGYKATVVHDAVATRDLEFNGTVVPAAQVHAALMASLGFAYAAVRSTDELLAEGAAAVA